MSHLNNSLPGFGISRTRVQHGYPLRKINLNLRVLARAILSAINLKASELTSDQAEQVMTDSECNSCTQELTQDCREHLSDTEYQHLVELGHWHHRRQRRLNRRLSRHS